jgi:hypothetical protein
MRGTIAFIAALAAFPVPVGIMLLPILGLADTTYTFDLFKTWLAYAGPLAGMVLGHYFKSPMG